MSGVKWATYLIVVLSDLQGLIGTKARNYGMIWHLDVGLPIPKSVVSLLVWVHVDLSSLSCHTSHLVVRLDFLWSINKLCKVDFLELMV